jgi:hypothetical protein
MAATCVTQYPAGLGPWSDTHGWLQWRDRQPSMLLLSLSSPGLSRRSCAICTGDHQKRNHCK